MFWILYLVLTALLLVGLYINLVGAPGLWLMVAGTIGYAWVTHWKYVGLGTIIFIVIVAGLAEAFEFLAAGAVAKRAGASRRGVIGAMIGGILGALFLTVSVPIPAVGTILGVCLGTFLGALVGELTVGTELGGSVRVGVGAVWGRLLGTFTKLLFGCAILGTVLWMAMPFNLWHRGTLTKPGTTQPSAATLPSRR